MLRSIVQVLIGVVALSACTPRLEPPALTRFQAAVDVTVTGARRVLMAVRTLQLQAEREAEAYALVLGQATAMDGSAAEAVLGLSAERLRLHLLLLDGIAAYAEALNRIAALPSQRRLPMDVGAVADELLSLTDAFAALGVSSAAAVAAAPADPGAGAAPAARQARAEDGPESVVEATRRLGQFLIVRHPRAQVPAVVRSLHPSIRRIVETLAADLGPRFPGEGAGPGAGSGAEARAGAAADGLGASLERTRVQLAQARRRALAVLGADTRLDPAARYAAAVRMAALPAAFDRVLADLAALQDALRLLVAAHAKLVDPESDAAVWRTGVFYRAAALVEGRSDP